jgi:hypothetical protein
VLLAIVCAVIGWREFRSYAAGDIRARLHQADTSVTDAFRAARRAMNDAAGQSWRNLTD